ncbi:MAG: hypothetical protein QOH35_2989 [Acidobacteriaceae bacterium]|nr:hypothetical protein [Acidobacteriaceae bacterium]
MTYPVTHILTLALAATLSTAAAGAQALPNQSVPATTTPTNVARVYVQTAKGVNVYNTSSTGKLTLVLGSPFKNTVGLMIGTAGSHFITVGTTYLHSYAIRSTGGIGAQVAQINSALYPGAADCGTTHGGTIDRTGTEAYIQLDGTGQCAALQTFKINATTGAFTLGGVAEFGGGTYPSTIESPLLVTGNNGHAYTFTQYYCDKVFSRFYRDRFGAMNDDDSSTITFPPPDGGEYFPLAMASDNQNVPTGHMAVAIHEDFEACGNSSAPALASYTVDYYGNLFYNGAMLKPAINPQGTLLAVSAATSDPMYTKDGPGLQVFHFNGGKPITGYSNVLTRDPISSVAWDKNYHLYATSRATNKLYVFTITPTSITPVPGSPFTLNGPSTLVVRPL